MVNKVESNGNIAREISKEICEKDIQNRAERPL
jgi:hypothetical protein